MAIVEIPPGRDRRTVLAELETCIETATDRLLGPLPAGGEPGDKLVDRGPAPSDENRA